MLDYILFFLFILYIAFLPTCDSYKCGGVAVWLIEAVLPPGLRSFHSLDRVTHASAPSGLSLLTASGSLPSSYQNQEKSVKCPWQGVQGKKRSFSFVSRPF